VVAVFTLAPLVLAGAVVLWLAWRVWRLQELPSARLLGAIAGASSVVLILRAGYYVLATYLAWYEHPISRYLLPPHTAWTYFAGYAWFRFFLPAAVSIAAALVWWAALLLLERWSRGALLDRRDAALGLLTALLVGWPRIIVYLASLFALMLVLLTVTTWRHGEARLALTWPMLLATCLTLVVGQILLHLIGADALKA
jgi:hypothetical protein